VAFGQLVIVPVMILEPTLVEELSSTERGEKGFGEADEEVHTEA
jgi:dUTPase